MNKIDISSGAVGNNNIIKNVFNNALKEIDSSMLYSYPNPLGLDILRKQIADLLSIDKTILITNSATEALYLSLSNIVGHNIAIQSPSYFGVIRQLKQLKINHLPWDNIKKLKEISNSGNIKAIYVNSNYNAIDGQSLSEGEKREIIDIGQNRGIQIIEDNPCDLLSFDKMGSNISNNLQNSIYIGSFSKILLPGLRLGFLSTNNDQIKKLKSLKITMNLSSSILNQLVASYALKQDYIEQLSDYYKKQWIQFKKLLIEYGLTEFEEPKGGIFVKINLSKSINIEKLVKNIGDKGVTIEENKFYYVDNKNRPYIRLNFVNNSVGINKKAISILAKKIEKLKQFI